jgi:hypothetical protein
MGKHNPEHPSRLTRAAKKGRPPKELWPDQIEELAAIQCTLSEMAAVFGCDVATLQDDPLLMERVKRGRERGKSELRKAQFKKAIKDNSPPLQIWLGKNYLNQSENPHIDRATAQNAFEKWLDKGSSEQSTFSEEDKQ